MFLWKSLSPNVLGGVFKRLAATRRTPSDRDRGLDDPRSRSKTDRLRIRPADHEAPARPRGVADTGDGA